MEILSREPEEYGDGDFHVLWRNPSSARRVVHPLINGKHIDHHMAEEFRFLESHPTVWEVFFGWLGYKLRRSELGGSPFYYLEGRTELMHETRLSRGATFLGLYLAWHFFIQGPGEPDRISPEEIFRRLLNSYPFPLLRSIFTRRTTAGAGTMELTQDQAEKLQSFLRRDISELARYRFIDVKPNIRAAWEDLVILRLPALYRFWELALHVRTSRAHPNESTIEDVVAEVWGSVEADPDEDE